MNFTEAIAALDEGEIVRNRFWPADKVGVFKQVPAVIPAEVVPKMTSLSDQVKEFFQKSFEDPAAQINTIFYTDQIALIGQSNSITGFQFTTADILSGDFEVVKYKAA